MVVSHWKWKLVGSYRTPKKNHQFNRGYASYVKTVLEMKPTFLTIASPSHRSEYSSTKQPHTPSMLISIHSPLTRRHSLSYSYVQSPLLQVNLSLICLSYANVCWNANHIIIVLVLMLVSIHSLLLSLPPSSSFSSIYSQFSLINFLLSFFPLYLPI